jgi:phage shock protein E
MASGMGSKTGANAAPILVDVRSPGEFASGHVEGALNMPLDRLQIEAPKALPDPSAEVVLYCLSGARSHMAMVWLQQMGYTGARNGGSVGMVAMQTGRAIRRN